jgi:hypothetical protein
MANITIPIDTPGVREAVPAKTFEQLYIMDLAVRAHSMAEQDSIYVEYVPFDKATGDRLLTDRREIRLPLWEAVAAVPETAGQTGPLARTPAKASASLELDDRERAAALTRLREVVKLGEILPPVEDPALRRE